jgi:outer membrane protein assembly factor BamB
VWLTTDDERVIRIDAQTAELLYAHELPQLGFFPLVAEGSLWIIGSPGLNGDYTKVWRLNPNTLTQETISLPNVPSYGLAGGEGALWTLDPDGGGVWRIDPKTNRPTRLAAVGHHPVAVAAGEGLVWVGVQSEPLG